MDKKRVPKTRTFARQQSATKPSVFSKQAEIAKWADPSSTKTHQTSIWPSRIQKKMDFSPNNTFWQMLSKFLVVFRAVRHHSARKIWSFRKNSATELQLWSSRGRPKKRPKLLLAKVYFSTSTVILHYGNVHFCFPACLRLYEWKSCRARILLHFW